MSKEMEKLVEEIYRELSCVSWSFQRRDAEEFIARIGKAYAIGEINLPNEAARTWSMEDDHLLAWMKGWIAQGVRSFVALRKEENR